MGDAAQEFVVRTWHLLRGVIIIIVVFCVLFVMRINCLSSLTWSSVECIRGFALEFSYWFDEFDAEI